MNDIYTIGYSSFTVHEFIEILKKYQIEAVVDVRSSPSSSYFSDYDSFQLKEKLSEYHIYYVPLGKECGARPVDISCYRNGKVSFDLLAKTALFKSGILRILNGARKMRIALMCAEKDPITCHRTILICKNLKRDARKIFHIKSSGNVESQEDLEKRLLQLHGLDQASLLSTDNNCDLDKAYALQEAHISYSMNDEGDKS